jgi:hypothetical protein
MRHRTGPSKTMLDVANILEFLKKKKIRPIQAVIAMSIIKKGFEQNIILDGNQRFLGEDHIYEEEYLWKKRFKTNKKIEEDD